MPSKKKVRRPKSGHPPIYETAEELEKAIDNYFASCVPSVLTDANNEPIINQKTGAPILKENPPTITGLALAIGYSSRQSIYDQEKREDTFSYVIKRARLRCQNYLERGLLTNEIPQPGGIFILKNHGWRDNFGITDGDGGRFMPEEYDLSKLSDAELEQWEQLAKKVQK